MKKLFSILSLCFLLTLVFTSFQGQTQSNSEPPTWARVYYEEAEWMQVYSVLENNTNDGYFITGYSSSWILKLSSEEGDVEWKQVDTYPDGTVFRACSIQQTIDGGYVAIGSYRPEYSSTGPGFGVIKFSQQFDVEWARNCDGPFYENPWSIQQTSDGGYILAGATISFIDPPPPEMAFDVWVLKLSSTGDVEWQKVYGGLGHEIQTESKNMVTILETSDGGYLFACDTNSFGAGWTDLWLVKLTSTGDIKWQKTYGGAQSEWFSIGGPHIQLTNDGGYIIAGSTLSFGVGYSDVWILRISSTGDIEWQKTYGGASGADFAHAIQPTNDGGYVITGGTNSFGVGSPDFWLLKISADGDIELQKTYGGDGLEEARCVQQTSDGGYIMAGTTNSFTPVHTDTLVIKVSPTGELGPGDGLIKVRNSDAVVLDTDVLPQDTMVTPRITNGSILSADPIFAERELLSEVVAWPFHQPPIFTSFTLEEDRGLTKGIRTDELKWKEHPYNQENNFDIEKVIIYQKRAGDGFRYYEKIKEVDPDVTEVIIEIDDPLEFTEDKDYALATSVGGIESPKSPAVGGAPETTQTSKSRVSSLSKKITQEDTATLVQPKTISQDTFVKSEQTSQDDKQPQVRIHPPVNVTVTIGENSQIIRWEQNPLNNPQSVTEYQVYRVWGEGDDIYYEFIGWVSKTESKFVDEVPDPDERFRYAVSAVSGSKESSKKPVKKIG